jgi:hypothetical protein
VAHRSAPEGGAGASANGIRGTDFEVVRRRKLDSFVLALAACIVLPLSFVAGMLWYATTYRPPWDHGGIVGDQQRIVPEGIRSRPPLDQPGGFR